MLKLNKKTEYALLALRFMSRETALSSAKSIAAWYAIPEMLLAKVLQALKHADIIAGTKGSGGGYALSRPLAEIPLLSVLDLFNEHVQLVDCLGDDHDGCQQQAHCDIRSPLSVLNDAILEPLRRMTVQDLFRDEHASARPRALSIYR
ncbi:MAG: Rrf2 family transcriptional regulator [Myxococcales bacterium]|nr:Rrf2 family transcriptional regulator [Myxococcales bacterium]MCB9733359.1 Rrf2 family transcriptional regulator [Deltaproteobacteria bacterium]